MKIPALIHLLVSAGVLLSVPTHAQEEGGQGRQNTQNRQQQNEESEEETNTEETDDNRRFWQASLPGGHYMVALDRIASISMHEYALEGNMVVTEMVIDTNGRSLVRFYHVAVALEGSTSATARRVVERGKDLLDRAGQRAGTDIHNMVQKSYPTTTHAGMVEYRIMELRDLDALYKSAKSAWETGRGRRVTVR